MNQTAFCPCHLSYFYYSSGWGPCSALSCSRKKKRINYQTRHGLNWRQMICSGFFMLWLGSRFRCNSAETGFLYFVIQDTFFPRQGRESCHKLTVWVCVWGQPQLNNPGTLQDYPLSGIPGQVLISLIAILIVLQPLLNSPNPVAFPGILS